MAFGLVLNGSSVLVLSLIGILVLNLDRVLAPILLWIDLEVSRSLDIRLRDIRGVLDCVVVGHLRDMAYVLRFRCSGSIVVGAGVSIT